MTRAALLLPALLLALAPCATADDPAPKTITPPAARVVAAIGSAAAENAGAPAPARLAGDALADLYVRRAAAAAEGDRTAFLVGLAHAFDDAGTLARLPGTDAAFRDIETPEAAAARRQAMGAPTLRGRGDLLLHFVVSAALSALAGERVASVAGVAKELSDMNGPSGFSFADLLADDAGISFARWLGGKDGAARLGLVAKGFAGADHMPSPAAFPDGIAKEAFARDYGSIGDPRFHAKRAEIAAAIRALAARWDGAPAPAPGTPPGDGWTQVGPMGEFPISGLAFAGRGDGGVLDYLALRDHPHPGGLRRVSVTPGGKIAVQPVDWDCGAGCPRDAEAISTVPGFPGHFLVVSSEGGWFHLALSGDGKATTLETGTLDVSAIPPAEETSLEGFTLQALGGGKDYVAVWGNRGRGKAEPGLLVWAPATVTAAGANGCAVAIGKPAASERLSTPEPAPLDAKHRDVAELKLVSSGVLWAVSTRKPDDPKDFASAVYVVGTISVRAGSIVFQRAHALAPLWSYAGHKVEALEIAPDGGFLLGADDESEGGRLLRVP